MDLLTNHPEAALIRERVKAGTEWLDLVEPEWRERVNTERLDISSCTTCVLGQIFDPIDQDPYAAYITGFAVGSRLLQQEPDRVVDDTASPNVLHGFDTWEDDTSPYTYDALEAGWLEVLQ